MLWSQFQDGSLAEKLKILREIGVITPVKDSTWSSAVSVDSEARKAW